VIFTAIVILLLCLLGAGILYALWRLLARVDAEAEDAARRSRARDREPQEPPEVTEPLGPDGVVYLAAHRFIPPGAPRGATNVRRRAFAPLTGEEVEPRQMAEALLYAPLVVLIEAHHLEPRLGECEPSFMPPFPHKRWLLRLVRHRRLAGSPLAEALDCAFDLVEQRTAKRGGDVKEGLPLDELVEEMLKVMRQELSFWDKAGIYADIRQYVEAALVDQGYLIPPVRDTWFDKLRHARPTVNAKAQRAIEKGADRLAAALTDFRQRHGSGAAKAADSPPGGRAEDVEKTLIEAGPPFDELPLHDCLRVSVYEALLAIRQLEPSEDVGV
jgi:hypothetical protein